MEKLEESTVSKISRAKFNVKLLPYFMGLTTDLIFYIAISTLFLTTIKGLSAAQISILYAVSSLIYIVFQRLFLKFIKILGNKKSVVLGTLLLLFGSIIITFGETFSIIMIGEILYTVAFMFKMMDKVILKHNLEYLGKDEEYINYSNKANVVYSIATFFACLCSGYLFNLNYYLPMYICIFMSFINVILGLFITEEKKETDNTNNEKSEEKVSGKMSKTIILLMVCYGVFFAVITRGQSNSQLLIQYEMGEYFDIGKTAVYFSYILVASRISRILANLSFYKLYAKLKDMISYLLPICCLVAFSFIIGGYFIETLIIKFILMGFGFCLILGIRDMFGTYMQDLLLKKYNKKELGIANLGLSKTIAEMLLSFSFSLILLNLELLYVIIILVVLAIISFVINYRLYQEVKSNE